MRVRLKNLSMLACILGLLLLMESIRWLDLIPAILLFSWSLLIGGLVVLFAMVAFLFVILQRRRSKLRFSTRSLLLLAIMVAWPVSRLTSDMRAEHQRSQSQKLCFEMLMRLIPGATLIQMAGRYNDGQADNLIQAGLCQIASWGLNPNLIPFEVCYITSIDMTNSSFGDDEMLLVANTKTVSKLNLTSTRITDAGLEHLYELHSLKLLNLTNTSVSNTAIEALQKRLPELSVVR